MLDTAHHSVRVLGTCFGAIVTEVSSCQRTENLIQFLSGPLQKVCQPLGWAEVEKVIYELLRFVQNILTS